VRVITKERLRLTSQVLEQRGERWRPVRVLVRIDVGRIPAGQVTESLKLTPQLLLDQGDIVAVHDRVERRPPVFPELPLPKVDVEAEAEIGVLTRVPGRLLRRRPPNHQARACNDPLEVRAPNAFVYA
jgi:hypothetical protein